MFRARRTVAVLISGVVIASGAGAALAGVDVTCTVTGNVSLEPETASVHLSFAGVTAGCTDPRVEGASVQLDGTFSCGTSDGSGQLQVLLASGATSVVPTVIA